MGKVFFQYMLLIWIFWISAVFVCFHVSGIATRLAPNGIREVVSNFADPLLTLKEIVFPNFQL